MDASTTYASQAPPQHSLKRDHDSFTFDDLANLEQPFTADAQFKKEYELQPEETDERHFAPLATIEDNLGATSPNRSRRSSTSSLTDAASATPSLRAASQPISSNFAPAQEPSPPLQSAFAVLNGNGNAAAAAAAPPLKKAKLTFAEREVRRITKEFKDQEKAAEKAKKEAERAAQAEERARREADKEAERKKREADKEERRVALDAEKAAKEERKRKKEEERRLKEEEKLRLEEEKKKKKVGPGQKTLGSFFAIPAATARRNSVEGRRSQSPAPANAGFPTVVDSASATTPGKKPASTYEKMFLDFFVQDSVTMAPVNRFERDEEASEAVQHTIDSYMLENRSPDRKNSFDAVSLFYISGHGRIPRGKRFKPVREIMAELSGDSSRTAIDLTRTSQNSQIKRTGDLLQKIPMKFLKFQEDVRPPYRGTYTSRPIHGIAKLARNPLRRDLPNTNYDYDSEGEWVEDEDADAEDLNSEGEEEDLEMGGEHDEDMDGFLDDEGDESANLRRLVLQGDIEPVSTGLCWEDCQKKSTNVQMVPYRMEMILDPRLKSINPFSNEYWPAPASKQKMEPPRVPLNAIKSNTLNGSAANIKAIKPFFTPASEFLKSDSSQQQPPQVNPSSSSSSMSGKSSTAATARPEKPKKLLPQEDMPSFLDAVRGSDLSKLGLIEVLKKRFPGRTAGQVKATLEMCARRVGAREVDKRWVVDGDVGGD